MLDTSGMIPAPISTHPSRPRRRRFAVRRWPGWLMWLSLLSVGADAHIGPLLGITCVAPVGRGDHTPSSVHSRSPCRGRALSRPVGARSVSRTNFRWFPNTPSRRGGPVCPPADGSREEPCPGRHIGRPLQNLHLPPNRAGTEPRPYVNAGGFPQRRGTPLNDEKSCLAAALSLCAQQARGGQTLSASSRATRRMRSSLVSGGRSGTRSSRRRRRRRATRGTVRVSPPPRRCSRGETRA